MIGLPLFGGKKHLKGFGSWLVLVIMLSEWTKDLHNLLYMNLLLCGNKLNRHKQI